MSECLKYLIPGNGCMKYAIISHNIDFVTFLMNEYNIEINLFYCGDYHNLELLLIYFDQTNNFSTCFIFSTMFNIPSFWDYFLSWGEEINIKDQDGMTVLHISAMFNNNQIVELLLSHCANINEHFILQKKTITKK